MEVGIRQARPNHLPLQVDALALLAQLGVQIFFWSNAVDLAIANEYGL